MLISDFGVEFPDFPGCVTAGTTLEEARRLAAEALALHVAGMQKDGEPLPPPSSLDAAMSNTGKARSVHINVMLPEDIVQAIDRSTTNCSRFLVEAARAKWAAA
jgi:predicted RNase H-like HicB family nuclease